MVVGAATVMGGRSSNRCARRFAAAAAAAPYLQVYKCTTVKYALSAEACGGSTNNSCVCKAPATPGALL